MRFQLLGPLEVTRDGARLRLGGPKQRLVLAHLLIRPNEVVSADRLIDEIWGDEPPDAARSSLQSYISHLRKELGSDRLEGRARGYVLHVNDEEIDARRFEGLVSQARRRLSADPGAAARGFREALALWHGEPLADLANEISLQPEILRLTEIRLAAHEDLAEAELLLGRHAELVPELDRLIGLHPLRERLAAQLMLALYRTGRQSDALAAYHRLRNALDSELGLDPSPAIETLQQQILSHDPTLDLRGEPLRGYRLVGQIGAGPTGTVHRAFDPHTERDVAIKVLGRHVANDADFVRRFDAEAARVARLEHPHVVPLLDWWREPDAAYLVTRLMTGGSLAGRLARGRPSSTLALHWAEQLGAAITAAHRQGVVHGDVRPGNVLFDADDNAFLSDFAIGTDSTGDDRYLAPERRAGADRSTAADIYAFSAMLDELLASSVDEHDSARLTPVLRRASSPNPADRHSTASELVAAVKQAVLEPSPTRRPGIGSTVGPPRNPYKGLRAFEEADAGDFVGREDLVRQLVARMSDDAPGTRLLAVVGPSGTGKSSVVGAGLVPALRRGAVAHSEEWFVAAMTPGHRPFEQLERALLGVAVNAPASLVDLLYDAAGLRPALGHVLPEGAALLLVIDQFEELFTLADARTRDRFLDALARTLDDVTCPIRIVVTLRSDFYDRPLRHDRFGRHLAAGTHAVPPMTPDELERAVTEPAERAGLRPEPGLAARIVAEMTEQPGALPLLQYALSELWERRSGAHLSLAGYESSGGIAGAVSRRAENLVMQLDDEGREAARQLFLRLIEPGEGTADTARRVRLGELESMAADASLIGAVTESFTRYRLLLLDRDPETREPTVELAHEALLRAWPRLQGWVDDARDDLRNQRRLAAAAAQWIEGGRDPSFLLTGSRLDQADAWASSTTLLLDAATHEYLAASLAERHRHEAEEQRRLAHEAALERRALFRLRALVVVLGVGALLAGALSVYALREGDRAEREARNAGARELAAAAVANLDVDAERSILLALQAIDATRSVDGSVLREAEEALHRAVVASRVVLTVPGEGGDVDWATTPDGRSLLVTQGPEESGMVSLRDATTGEVVVSWRGHAVDVNDVAFSADGSMLATTGDDGLLRVWQTADGSMLAEVPGNGRVLGPSFSPDGSLVAAAWEDEGSIRTLERESGEVRTLPAPETQATAFSPDGRHLAAGPWDGTVRVLGARALEAVMTLEADAIGSDIAYSPDGRWLAAAGEDATAKIWDATTGALRHSVAGHASRVMAVAWADDSRYLVTGSADGSAVVWEIADTGYRRVVSFASQDLPGGVDGVAVAPGGDRILVGAWIVGAAKIWDAGRQGDAEVINLEGEPDSGLPLAFTSDTTLALGASEGVIAQWDIVTGAQVSTITQHAAETLIYELEASRDGTAIASIGEDGLRIWESATGQTIQLTPDPGDIAWRPDGQQVALAVYETSTVKVFDRAGALLRVVSGDPRFRANGIDVRADGLLAAAEVPIGRADLGANRVTLRAGGTGELVASLPAPGLTYSGTVSFDPTGDRLALGFLDGRVEIWSLESDARLLLAGHVGDVLDVAFSADGSRLATAGEDGTVRVWDAATGVPQLVLRGHGATVARVQFSPDGSALASASFDGQIRVWALDLDDLVEIARRNATRPLTDQECREYLRMEACPVASE